MVAKIVLRDKDGNYHDCVLMLGHNYVYDVDECDLDQRVASEVIGEIKSKIAYLKMMQIDEMIPKHKATMSDPELFSRESFVDEFNLHLNAWLKVLDMAEDYPNDTIVCV